MKIWGIVRSAAELITARYLSGGLKQPNLTLQGNVAVETILSSPGGLVPSAADLDDGSVAVGQTVAIGIVEPYVYSGVSNTWIRTQALLDNSDAQAALGVGAQGIIARLQGWNGATFDRVRTQGNNADGVAADAAGRLGIAASLMGWNGATYDRLIARGNNADGIAVDTLGRLVVNNANLLYNETTVDRMRNNVEGIALASAVRNTATSINSADIIAYNARGIICFFDVTAVAGGAVTVTAKIQSKDQASGKYFDVPGGSSATGLNAQTAAISAISNQLFQNGNVNNAFNSNIMSRTWRIVVTHSAVGNFTYSVGYSLMY